MLPSPKSTLRGESNSEFEDTTLPCVSLLPLVNEDFSEVTKALIEKDSYSCATKSEISIGYFFNKITYDKKHYSLSKKIEPPCRKLKGFKRSGKYSLLENFSLFEKSDENVLTLDCLEVKPTPVINENVNA